jgi:ribonucleotide reductase beta subunit family protein with ferritin-like domain
MEKSALNSKLLNNCKNSDSNASEYILNSENNRLTIYPIKHIDIWNCYLKQVASFWTPGELDFSKDHDDYKNKLNENEQYFIKMILAFFSSADTIVNINLGERFIQEVKIKEAIVCYDFQKMMENIHNETYSLQIENIIKNPEEKEKLLKAVEHFDCIAEKANWAVGWIESDKSFAHRVVAFAIMEGVFFSGSFCAIYWLKKRNIMPGLCASNELIARDEAEHCQNAVLLYSMLEKKVEENEIHQMFEQAVKIETKFICESLPCSLLGMNSVLMTQYIKFVADRLLVQLGYSKLWNATNPFDFMESICLEGKKNFFEGRPTQYQKASVLNKTKDEAFNFTSVF